jgi:hypothetical protein
LHKKQSTGLLLCSLSDLPLNWHSRNVKEGYLAARGFVIYDGNTYNEAKVVFTLVLKQKPPISD